MSKLAAGGVERIVEIVLDPAEKAVFEKSRAAGKELIEASRKWECWWPELLTIEAIDTCLVDLPTIRPHVLSMTTIQQQTLVLVQIRCSDGIVGIGEGTTIGGLSYGEESPEGIKPA